MKDATPPPADESFSVVTPRDFELFSDKNKASDWALAVVMGGFAPWANVGGPDGQVCHISGPEQPPQKNHGPGEALHTLPVMSIG